MMNLNYYYRSLKTRSYWAYALWSVDSVKTFFAVLGGIWTIADIARIDTVLGNYPRLRLLMYLAVFALLVVIFTRRPLTKVVYKHPGKDLTVEVRMDDLFKLQGQKVISSNTTFDTDISGGIISPRSLQGQFTENLFQGDIQGLDSHINQALQGEQYTTVNKPGKTKRYEFGTTVKFRIANEYYYWFAMSDLNSSNNAKTDLKNVQKALDGLWEFIEEKGEKQDTVIPLIGAGLGRIKTKKKKLIAAIAQSFISANEENIFVDKLTIVIHPSDVQKFELNLFEVKDLLNHYLP